MARSGHQAPDRTKETYVHLDRRSHAARQSSRAIVQAMSCPALDGRSDVALSRLLVGESSHRARAGVGE
jgi:hypothetical protein